MRKLHDYSNWLAAAGVVALTLVMVGAAGKIWIAPALLTAVGGAVRLKYGMKS